MNGNGPEATPNRIAVVDDELTLCRRLAATLEKQGFAVETFGTGRTFLSRAQQQAFDVALVDLRLPDLDGIELVTEIKGKSPDTECIVITGYSSIDSAIQAIKAGAFHYCTKPVKLQEIRSLIEKALEGAMLRRDNRRLRKELQEQKGLPNIIGNSAAIQPVFATIRKVAPVDCNVLLQGASGTGKELVARAIHNLGARRDGPFVAFNCGGFTEELIASELFGHERGAFTGAGATRIGLLESGAGGTVFLDEIGEMSPAMQVKLLHVIQERRILRVGGVRPIELNIRIVAASNKNLKEEVEQGNFREDLFYRLNVVAVHLPRLADRREDIPLLIRHFIEKYAVLFGKRITGIERQALRCLENYSFPGNVRELENIIERAIALSDHVLIQFEDLPPDIRQLEVQPLDGEELLPLEEMEKRYIARVLRNTDHNRNRAAQILRIPRTTLWRKLKRFRLDHS
ncbi:MAG: Fis family transcriptional regulator [Syntrophobacteraceae bacterium CG2_30_61_12]|nr:MAG: Fis family transcriptional regulator [Syntrophobacteraceae bacterium CG2_30_61_12]